MRSIFWAVLVLLLVIGTEALSADLFADVDFGGYYSSNVFLDNREQWDLVFDPTLDLGIDFADFWSIGYLAEAEIFTQDFDLSVHKHNLYLLANPSWGKEDENEFLAQVALETQQNTAAFSSIDYVKPIAQARIVLEPRIWARWTFEENASYRAFYNDSPSSSIDAWTSSSLAFTLPSRTTLTPRVNYGFRYYPKQEIDITEDTVDQQIKLGLGFSQALWERGGLQGGYTYTRAIGESGLILRKLSTTDFSYIGEDFLYSGHQGYLNFKQVFQQSGWRFGVGLTCESKHYNGWFVLATEDGSGPGPGPGPDDQEWTDDERKDVQVMPNGWVEYVYSPGEDSTKFIPEIVVRADYSYLRQLSNDSLYDTWRQLLGIHVELTW